MTDGNRMNTLRIAAAVLLAAGAVMSLDTVRKMTEVSARLRLKQRDLNVLRSMESDLLRCRAAVDAWKHYPAPSPTALMEALRDTLPIAKSDDVRDFRKESVPGWFLRQKEISLPEASIGTAMAFVRKAEALSPPWRLSKAVIRSSPRAPGSGQVILLMETLERTE